MKITCHYCGEEFARSPYAIQRTRKAKWLNTIDACKKCLPKKKADINAARAAVGDSPHTDRKHNPETMKRAAEKRMKSEGYQRMLEERTGKTLEEFYGEEGAANVREANRRQHAWRTCESKWPNKGNHHSDEARQKMSLRAVLRMTTNTDDDWLRSRGIRGRYMGMRYDSSYELAFILKCQEENQVVTRVPFHIEYMWEGKTHRYLPDFIVGDTVIEIKPSNYINRPLIRALSMYIEKVETKFEALETYCQEHSLRAEMISEVEIGPDWIRKAKKLHEELQNAQNQT
jgi:hypothetical protein